LHRLDGARYSSTVRQGGSPVHIEPDVSPAAPEDPWAGCNPFDPDFRNDPYPPLHRLRERDPVNVTPIGIWRLTRYADVNRLLHDVPAGVRTTDGILPGVDESLSGQREFMLQQDAPAHTRLRRLVSHAFTPKAINSIRATIQGVVDDCLDRVAPRGEMDVIADLALPVPATVICEMMGVPIADRDRFTVWTSQATFGLAAPILPPEVLEQARAAGMALADYFQGLIAERRTRLGDDLLSTLIRAEEAGDRLSPSELLSQSIGLLIAGFETTIGLIGNGVRALIRHPAELAKLRARPELAASAVDECLRFEGPIVLTPRILHADAEFGGKTIPKDTMVWGMLAAANRDPAAFPDPDRFDVERKPNDHLAFGGGPHYCIGAFLAKTEGQLAIGSLVQRFRDLALDSEVVEWGPSLFRVPGRLPIRFRAG
jgi:cytochrome P450